MWVAVVAAGAQSVRRNWVIIRIGDLLKKYDPLADGKWQVGLLHLPGNRCIICWRYISWAICCCRRRSAMLGKVNMLGFLLWRYDMIFFLLLVILFRSISKSIKATTGTRTDRFAIQIETVSRNLRAGTTSILPESGRLGSSLSLSAPPIRTDPQVVESPDLFSCSSGLLTRSLASTPSTYISMYISPCHWLLISEWYAIPLSLAPPDGTPFS